MHKKENDKMNRSESKFHNTAVKMQNALMALLEDRDFSEISIMDVCRSAEVNRSTFYAHYETMHDLLEETYRALIEIFLAECSFGANVDLRDIRNMKKDDLNFCTPEYLVPYLNYIKAHRTLYRAFVKNARSFETEKIDDMLIETICLPIYERHGVTDKKLVTYMQKFFLRGIEAILHEWVGNNCADDVQFVCDVIMSCIRN